MARRFQSSFAAGEIDPALRERTSLDKYDSGLATARNVLIGKTGRVISRSGLERFKSFGDNQEHLVYHPPDAGGGWLDVYENRIKIMYGATFAAATLTVTLPIEDLGKIHFIYEPKLRRVHLLREGKEIITVTFDGNSLITDSIVQRKLPETGSTLPTIQGTGYRVDYAITIVDSDGVESEPKIISNATYLQVLTNNHINNIQQTLTLYPNAREMRLYRRPYNTGAFGYVGSSFTILSGSMTVADQGIIPDYSTAPPEYLLDFQEDVPLITNVYRPRPKTGIIYQNRFVMSGTADIEINHTSRVGKFRSWTRDFPFTSTSGLTFNLNEGGAAKVLRYFNAGVLVAFTRAGVFSNNPGALTVDNIGFARRGEWVIQENLPPLVVPGTVLFVDSLTNSVMAMNYSEDAISFVGEEISIYSAHFLRDDKISSWVFCAGDIPTVLAVTESGKGLAFTYQKEQQLRAWTWFDTDGKFKQVSRQSLPDGTDDIFFTVERDGALYMEKLTSRRMTTMREYPGFDAMSIWSRFYGWEPIGMDGLYQEAPVLFTDPDDNGLDGELTVTAQEVFEFITSDIFENSVVGDKFRIFFDDQSFITFTINSVVSDTVVTATPDREMPIDEMLEPHYLYYIANQVTGLTHLATKDVSVHVDGYVISSPLNPDEDYDTLTVSGAGVLTLPAGVEGAFIKVGLPIPHDVETLDVATVEQKPTLIESTIASTIYLKLFNSRGVFTGQNFPADDTVDGMESSESRDAEIDVDGNGPQLPYTERIQIMNPSDWTSNGRVCVRAVDGLPVEILSILPDFDISFKGE